MEFTVILSSWHQSVAIENPECEVAISRHKADGVTSRNASDKQQVQLAGRIRIGAQLWDFKSVRKVV